MNSPKFIKEIKFIPKNNLSIKTYQTQIPSLIETINHFRKK